MFVLFGERFLFIWWNSQFVPISFAFLFWEQDFRLFYRFCLFWKQDFLLFLSIFYVSEQRTIFRHAYWLLLSVECSKNINSIIIYAIFQQIVHHVRFNHFQRAFDFGLPSIFVCFKFLLIASSANDSKLN